MGGVSIRGSVLSFGQFGLKAQEAGVDAVKKIRLKGGKFSSIPIVALTANKDQEMIIKMIKAGANDYFLIFVGS